MATSEHTVSWTTASIGAGGTLQENRALTHSRLQVTKIKIVPSVVGVTSKVQLFQRDSFLVANLCYSSGNFAGTYYDPEELDGVVSTERTVGFVAVYEDIDASNELHIKLTNNDIQAKTYVVTVSYRVPLLYESGDMVGLGITPVAPNKLEVGGVLSVRRDTASSDRGLRITADSDVVSSNDGQLIQGKVNNISGGITIQAERTGGGVPSIAVLGTNSAGAGYAGIGAAGAGATATVEWVCDANGTLHNAGQTGVLGGNADNAVVLTNAGTVPIAAVADSVILYSEDVTASAELKVRDEASNITTLSPHNFELYTPDESYVYPWSYRAENGFIGKVLNVDMYGAIRAIEELSGKKFIYVKDIPVQDWDEVQQEIQDENPDYKKKVEPEWIKKARGGAE